MKKVFWHWPATKRCLHFNASIKPILWRWWKPFICWSFIFLPLYPPPETAQTAHTYRSVNHSFPFLVQLKMCSSHSIPWLCMFLLFLTLHSVEEGTSQNTEFNHCPPLKHHRDLSLQPPVGSWMCLPCFLVNEHILCFPYWIMLLFFKIPLSRCCKFPLRHRHKGKPALYTKRIEASL